MREIDSENNGNDVGYDNMDDEIPVGPTSQDRGEMATSRNNLPNVFSLSR